MSVGNVVPVMERGLKYEIGYGELPDDVVIAAVQKPDMKKIKTFVELLGGNVEIIDTWLVKDYY